MILLEEVAPVLDQNLCGKSPSSSLPEAWEVSGLLGVKTSGLLLLNLRSFGDLSGKIIEKWLDKQM